MSRIRPIAIHLPQFHPFEENNEWWGKGFTEWTNVSQASPRFKGHYQPHIPGELGFYDLRLDKTRLQQAEMARKYGIHGFCYYHYWFNGRRLMHEPLDRMLKSGQPDFPFMFCWANENWSRRWDGEESQVLIRQEYSEEDDLNHIRWLCREVFNDPRYIRIKGKPVFVVYKYHFIPDVSKTLDLWRKEAEKEGFPGLYLCGMQAIGDGYLHPDETGFDAAIEFQPNWNVVKAPKPFWKRAFEKLGFEISHDTIREYREIAEAEAARPVPSFRQYPGITPAWDNTSRRKKNAVILKGSTPELYGRWLQAVLRKFNPFSKEENFIFINAWNEWAEGNHLEPDRKWGDAYLETTKKILEQEKCL